jgi:hypothetical protein
LDSIRLSLLMEHSRQRKTKMSRIKKVAGTERSKRSVVATKVSSQRMRWRLFCDVA